MSDWIYIDKYDKLPDANFIHCDTRDFHITCNNSKINKDALKIIRKATDRNKFNRSEILGCLKTLELGTGGRASWRMINLKQGYAGWLKYIRFIKTKEAVRMLAQTEPVYVAYTTSAGVPFLLDRTHLDPDNVNMEDLNTIEWEENMDDE